MGEEAARADEALRRAAGGARVALVSSGDAGVHGMAARTLARAAELAEDERPVVAVVPGRDARRSRPARCSARRWATTSPRSRSRTSRSPGRSSSGG